MLSYRHSFHAGNFADVLKHIVLLEMLQHMIKKDKGFSYVDTHSGAGLYHLQSAHADKLQEYRQGVAKLKDLNWPELNLYQQTIAAFNSKSAKLGFYPGSPLIAAQFLRSQDHAWLYELHPEDYKRLVKNTQGYSKFKVFKEDGLSGLLGRLPPPSRRALVLIDPSYEIKSDYDAVFKTVASAYKKFATGSYAIWYPVVERSRIKRMHQQFVKSGIKDIQVFELGLAADAEGQGMTASGMLVINPPWQLMTHMQALLPKLTQALDETGQAFYRCDQLVPQQGIE